MMRFLAFAGLVALQIVLGTCDEPILIDSQPGSRIDLEAPRPNNGKLKNCTLESGAKKLYSLYPENESAGSYTGDGVYCAINMREIELSYAGLWTMTTITDKGKFTTEFIIRMTREVNARPSSVIWAYTGQRIKVGIDTNETDVKSCTVTVPGFEKYELLKEEPEGVSRHGLCGVEMLASRAMDGQWELHEQIGEYLVNHVMFHVNVPYESESESSTEKEVLEKTWVIGKEGKVSMSFQDTVFCQLTRPDGSMLPFMFGQCEMKVAAVTKYHEGTWHATYARVGTVQLRHIDIVIKTKDPKFIECTYSPGTGGEINILCKNGETTLKFCSFIRPDENRLNLPVGVGNDNYSYYGNGYDDKFSTDRDYAECGVTIHKPSAVDFGTWTCEMGMKDNTIRGSVINVANTRMDRNVRKDETSSTIFVKRSDSFKINCKADSKLKYCWLSSPNGTAYSVSSDGVFGTTLKYEGKGFAMGECGAIVPTSNDTDNGEWTCHLGIEGSFEVEQKVSVKITDSYLIANSDVVYAGEATKMSCRTFIGEEGTLQYCRWVAPNGHGINRADASRYKLIQSTNECSLTILDLKSEDIGKWTCVASLSRSNSQEEFANVQLRSTEREEARIASILSIVLGGGLLIMTAVGVAYAALYVFRKRNARVIRDPPPYYPDDYAIPTDIRTGAESIPNKDSRY